MFLSSFFRNSEAGSAFLSSPFYGVSAILVLLLERKPWVFALFLLFGLYVNDMKEKIKIKKVKSKK